MHSQHYVIMSMIYHGVCAAISIDICAACNWCCFITRYVCVCTAVRWIYYFADLQFMILIDFWTV